ncbi:MAG: MFS transporter [Nocardioides sp.]
MAVVGLISATVFTATAARALAAGQPSLAGVADAVVAVGSVAGGLWWGRAAPAWSTTRSLARLMSVLGLFSLVAGALDSFWLFTVALAGAGAALAPVYVVAYQASDHAVAPEEVTEASTWVNTAANLGVSLGAAVAGALVSSHGAHAPSVAGGAAALVVVAVVIVAAAGARKPRTIGG